MVTHGKILVEFKQKFMFLIQLQIFEMEKIKCQESETFDISSVQLMNSDEARALITLVESRMDSRFHHLTYINKFAIFLQYKSFNSLIMNLRTPHIR